MNNEQSVYVSVKHCMLRSEITVVHQLISAQTYTAQRHDYTDAETHNELNRQQTVVCSLPLKTMQTMQSVDDYNEHT